MRLLAGTFKCRYDHRRTHTPVDATGRCLPVSNCLIEYESRPHSANATAKQPAAISLSFFAKNRIPSDKGDKVRIPWMIRPIVIRREHYKRPTARGPVFLVAADGASFPT